jgi:putative hydrolase of the HAD superfamily
MALTHVLFDFFGTLVGYRPVAASHAASHALLARFGGRLPYEEFPVRWGATCAAFERAAARDHREYTMDSLVSAFLREALARPPTPAETAEFVATFLAEWNAGVTYRPGLAAFLTELAPAYRLAVVTNTHHAPLVPGHLAAMGVADAFDAVVTSVEVGWRKPHGAIFATALDRVGASAGQALFVGDTYDADYLGPRAAGLAALLIDPDRRSPVPATARLDSLFDLRDRMPR